MNVTKIDRKYLQTLNIGLEAELIDELSIYGDPYEEYLFYEDMYYEDDFLNYNEADVLRFQLIHILTEPRPSLPGHAAQLQKIWQITEEDGSNDQSQMGDIRLLTSDGLITRLVSYKATLTDMTSTKKADLLTEIRHCYYQATDQVDDFNLIDLLTNETEQIVPNLLLFAPFWIRPLHTWQPQGETPAAKVRSLIDHLLVYYPAPEFLYQAWISDHKWACWLILLGQGASLHRAAATFRWHIPRSLSHYLPQVPAEYAPQQAIMYAEVCRLGGSIIEFRRLSANRYFGVDPTNRYQPDYVHFWQETVRWLTRHRTALTDEEVTAILAWAVHHYTEAERAGERPFSWQGRSPQRALAAALAYEEECHRHRKAEKWPAQGWGWDYVDAAGQQWHFVELTNGLALYQEGQALHHCVGGYSHYCVRGEAAIVSVRCNELRCLTIEVSLPAKGLRQVRGLQNRAATDREKAVVDRWHKEIVLGHNDDPAHSPKGALLLEQ